MQDKRYNVVFVFTSCKKSGPIQQMLNLITYLDRTKFNPILITLYPESVDGTSQLYKYIAQNVEHYSLSLSKIDMMLGHTGILKVLIKSLDPDIIHSLGVFPDYAISRMKLPGHVITLRNFVFDDYPAKFGKLKGILLSKMHIYAMKSTSATFTCSKSLAQEYKNRLNLDFPYVKNGVDFSQYYPVDEKTKISIRTKLGLPNNRKILIYTGQFVSRKDQRFLLEIFKTYNMLKNEYLILLGGGSNYTAVVKEYGNLDNVCMPGNVDNVDEYLNASDVYISSSRSEGMPNGVLEAMASGLPVILSNIEQHKEIYDLNTSIGLIYRLGDDKDCLEKIVELLSSDLNIYGCHAYKTAHNLFNAQLMSINYQDMYLDVIKETECK